MHFVDVAHFAVKINHQNSFLGLREVQLAAIGEHEAVLLFDCLQYFEWRVAVDFALAENGPHEERAQQPALDL